MGRANKKWTCKACGQEWAKNHCHRCDITKAENAQLWICAYHHPRTTNICGQINHKITNQKCKTCGHKRKKTVLQANILSRAELNTKLETMADNYNPQALRDQTMMHCAFISLLYLTASRVSELCMTIRKKDIKEDRIQGQDFVIVTNLPTLKRRDDGKGNPRSCPINIQEEIHTWAYVKVYLDTLKPNDILFPFQRSNAKKVIKEKFGSDYYPHYFRHLRLTHLVQNYGFDSISLKQYVNWADIAASNWYIHIGWKDLANKLVIKK